MRNALNLPSYMRGKKPDMVRRKPVFQKDQVMNNSLNHFLGSTSDLRSMPTPLEKTSSPHSGFTGTK